MAWTAPATAVSNSLFSASWLNTYLRDNMLETMPSKATEAGQLFTVTAANQISATSPTSAYIATSQARTSATYGDLATVGPSVTVTMRAFVIIKVSVQVTTAAAAGEGLMSFAISGATTLAADDAKAVGVQGIRERKFTYYSALTASTVNSGSNTFTAKYRGDGTNAATFSHREISAIVL